METATPPLDADALRPWIGREERAGDLVTPRLVQGFNVTIGAPPGAPQQGDAAPHAIHWCLAPHIDAATELGPDGHAKRGRFIPPVPLPRRLWAGGHIEFVDRIRVGDAVTRVSTIADIAVKEGRSGALCFVTVTHAFTTPRGAVLRERQDIVYRGGEAVPSRAATPTAHPRAKATRSFVADAVQLFRYSALTFNGHRIHYDRSYCTEEEGYPGLVVHAPLMATLLIDFAVSLGGGTLRSFDYRGQHPLFDGHAFTVNGADAGDGLDLWIVDANGTGIMTAKATW